MKPFYLLVVFLCFSAVLKSQNQFFYSGKTKVYLREDSHKIMLYTQSGTFTNLSKFPITGVTSMDTVVNKNIVRLETKNGDVGALIRSLKKDSSVLHVWKATYGNTVPYIPTGEILVKPAVNITIKEILDKLQLLERVEILPYDNLHFGTEYLRVKEDSELYNIANYIYESGLVEFSHPNFFIPVVLGTNDTYYNYQDYLHNTNGIDVNIEPIWPYLNSNNIIQVSVLDDGLEAHEDISITNSSGWTPRASGGNGAPTAAGKHGECVAGIIGATANNSKGIAGVYQGPMFMNSVNVFYGGETVADYANALNYAWQNQYAAVINNSWNYLPGIVPPGFDAISTAISNARTLGRYGLGTVVVFSAGNGSGSVQYPATEPGVISVGALNSAGVHETYSATGNTLQLSANSWAGFQFTTDRMGAAGYDNGNYNPGFGATSGAAPQVTGVVASMINTNMNLTEAQIRSILTSTATDLGTPGYDATYGYGLVNGCKAVATGIKMNLSISGGTPEPSNPSITFFFCDGFPPSQIPTYSASPSGIVNITPFATGAKVTKIANGTVTITASIGTVCGVPISVSTDYNTSVLSRTTSSAANFTISPNPANGFINIKSSVAKDQQLYIAEVNIIDKMGNVVKRAKYGKGTSTVNLSTSDIPGDYYIIKVNDGKGWTEIGKSILITH